MDSQAVVALIYVIGGSIFLLATFAGFAWTLARVLYLYRHDEERPLLLWRDLVVWGGLSISLALISGIRFLPPAERIALTQGNVLWALGTTVPICIAAVTYLYFEVFVIRIRPQRGSRRVGDPK